MASTPPTLHHHEQGHDYQKKCNLICWVSAQCFVFCSSAFTFLINSLMRHLSDNSRLQSLTWGDSSANCINSSSSLLEYLVADLAACWGSWGFEPPLVAAYAPRNVTLRVPMESWDYHLLVGLLLLIGSFDTLGELGDLRTAYPVRANLTTENCVLSDHDERYANQRWRGNRMWYAKSKVMWKHKMLLVAMHNYLNGMII